MDADDRNKLRREAELNIKMQIYKQPAFPYYQSLGIFEFFYPVQAGEEMLGFLHIWWNKNKSSGIVVGNKESKGFWETAWYDDVRQKPKIEPFGPPIINQKKVMQIFHDEERRRMEKIALYKLQEEKLNRLKEPFGILKKYLS